MRAQLAKRASRPVYDFGFAYADWGPALGRGKPPAGPARAEDGGGGHHHSTRFKASPKFYSSDLNDIYNRVCGGLPCTINDHSSWDKLEAAVSAQWGEDSDEDIVWQEQGAYYGVDDHGAVRWPRGNRTLARVERASRASS